MLATAWRIDPRKTAYSLALVVAGAVAAPLLAAAMKWLTDAVVAGQVTTAAWAGVVVAALAVVTLTAGHFAHIFYFELSELAELDFDRQLVALSNGSHGIEHHERSESADALTVLRQESRRYRMGLEALMQCLALALAMVLTGFLLAMLDPVLLLLPLAALPPLLAGRSAERILDRSKTAVAEPTRLALNLFHLSTSARAAGELRTFRLREEVLRRHARLWETATGGLWRAHLAGTGLRAAGQVVFALAYIGAVLLIVREAIAGRRSVGDVVLVVALAAQVNQQVVMAVSLLQNLQRMGSAYRRLAELRGYVARTGQPTREAELPSRLRTGIRLAGVSVPLPGHRRAGAARRRPHPAGRRGGRGRRRERCRQDDAGQAALPASTSRPQGTIAGRRRRPAPAADRRSGGIGSPPASRTSSAFEFSPGRRVGVGDLPHSTTRQPCAARWTAPEPATWSTDLPDGLDTPARPSWADGVELSGGQWQKLALGRAHDARRSRCCWCSTSPPRPSTPETEHALFERYAAPGAGAARRPARSRCWSPTASPPCGWPT